MFCISRLNKYYYIYAYSVSTWYSISCNDKEYFYPILYEDLSYEKHDDILIHNVIWNNKLKNILILKYNIKILNYSTNYFYNKFVMDKQK